MRGSDSLQRWSAAYLHHCLVRGFKFRALGGERLTLFEALTFGGGNVPSHAATALDGEIDDSVGNGRSTLGVNLFREVDGCLFVQGFHDRESAFQWFCS